MCLPQLFSLTRVSKSTSDLTVTQCHLNAAAGPCPQFPEPLPAAEDAIAMFSCDIPLLS